MLHLNPSNASLSTALHASQAGGEKDSDDKSKRNREKIWLWTEISIDGFEIIDLKVQTYILECEAEAELAEVENSAIMWLIRIPLNICTLCNDLIVIAWLHSVDLKLIQFQPYSYWYTNSFIHGYIKKPKIILLEFFLLQRSSLFNGCIFFSQEYIYSSKHNWGGEKERNTMSLWLDMYFGLCLLGHSFPYETVEKKASCPYYTFGWVIGLQERETFFLFFKSIFLIKEIFHAKHIDKVQRLCSIQHWCTSTKENWRASWNPSHKMVQYSLNWAKSDINKPNKVGCYMGLSDQPQSTSRPQVLFLYACMPHAP